MQIVPYLISLALLALVSNTYVAPADEVMPADISLSQIAQVAGDAGVQTAPAPVRESGSGPVIQGPATAEPAPALRLVEPIVPQPQPAPRPPSESAFPSASNQPVPSLSGQGGGEGSRQGERVQPPMPMQQPQPQRQQQPQQAPGQRMEIFQQPQEGFQTGQAEEQERQEPPVDPREVTQMRRDMKQMLNELKRFSRALKRMPNNSDDLARIDSITGQINASSEKLGSASSQDDLRDVINDFRENNYWDEIQKIRAKVEIPNELARIEKDIKKIKTLISQASYKNLGINVEAIGAKMSEAEGVVSRVRGAINSGELDEANEEMRYFHEGGQPGELAGVLQRLREITSQLRNIKDKDIKSQIQSILNEIVLTVNSGDFRQARETMDEYANGLMKVINQASRIGRKIGGTSSNQVRSSIQNLENSVQQKLNAERRSQNQAAPTNNQPAPQNGSSR